VVSFRSLCFVVLGFSTCCLSAAKGDENKELRFEEMRKDPCWYHYENHGHKSFCASLHLK